MTSLTIVAEVGSNWRNMADCINSISLAQACGATAVKFQAFSYDALYGLQEIGRLVKTGPTEWEADWSKIKHELPLEWLPELKAQADRVGIDFMCTAFSPELVAVVDPYVKVHKVASSDLTYPQLLKAVAKTGKPILLSTGASGKGDVSRALECLGEARARTTLMYCNASYPSRHHNLAQIDSMHALWDLPIGFSDHSLDVVYAPLMAVQAHGCTVIEKHFTICPEVDTPDRGHSLDAGDFKIFCDHLLGKTATSDFQPSREEGPMFLRHNRRLVATRDIAPGQVLRFGQNYGAYRTLQDDSRGMSPFVWDHPNWGPEGKNALQAIKQGKGIGPGDF